MFIKSKACFVAIPRGDDFDEVLKTVLEALEEANLTPLMDLNVEPGSNWNRSLSELIQRADFVIADVTGADTNIGFILGAAQALRKPTLIVAQEQAKPLPSDLAGQQLLVYRTGEMGKLRDYLRYWIRDTLELQNLRSATSYSA